MPSFPSIAQDPDVATTTKLLRAPATVVTAAFLLGLVGGEAARLYRQPGEGLAVGWYLGVSLVTIPFLLPSRVYRSGRTAMRAWIAAAAIAASIRVAYMCVWLFSRRPAGEWLVVAGLYLAVLGTLWLAVYAVFRSQLPRPDPFGPIRDAP